LHGFRDYNAEKRVLWKKRGLLCFFIINMREYAKVGAAPDLDGGGPEAQAWWEASCADRI